MKVDFVFQSERKGESMEIAAPSQRKAARVAGLFYLCTTAIVVFSNFAIDERIVARTAADTARNIAEHERLFRVSIACDLMYAAGLVVLLTSLYVILKPVNQNLALIAAAWRFLYLLTWVLMALNVFLALQILGGAEYLRAFETDRLHILARFYLGARFWQYYVGLVFYGMASAICGYLFWQSRYIPRALAAFGVISSTWAAACALVFIVFPGFQKIVNLWWFDSPLGIFEIATGFWLLFRGINTTHAESVQPGA